MTTVRVRPRAGRDLIERIRYYRAVGGVALAERFADAASEALWAIERRPHAGSPRLGELCEVPGLRVRRVKGFPCNWLYVMGDDVCDVVRLLADQQDIPSILGGARRPRGHRGG